MIRDRAGECPCERSHHLQSRPAVHLRADWLGAHKAKIPRPVTGSWVFKRPESSLEQYERDLERDVRIDRNETARTLRHLDSVGLDGNPRSSGRGPPGANKTTPSI